MTLVQTLSFRTRLFVLIRICARERAHTLIIFYILLSIFSFWWLISQVLQQKSLTMRFLSIQEILLIILMSEKNWIPHGARARSETRKYKPLLMMRVQIDRCWCSFDRNSFNCLPKMKSGSNWASVIIVAKKPIYLIDVPFVIYPFVENTTYQNSITV